MGRRLIEVIVNSAVVASVMTSCSSGTILPQAQTVNEIKPVDESASPTKTANVPKAVTAIAQNATEKTATATNASSLSKGKVFYQGSLKEKKIALTFDDGPNPKFTNDILKILKDNGIKGTFFILGSQAQKYPDLVKKIKAEGHIIGNHTWDHANLTKLNEKQVLDELQSTQKQLNDILGYEPALFRPPFGATNAKTSNLITSKGLNVICWNIDTKDWKGTTDKEILKQIEQELKYGSIILQHDSGGKHGDLSNTVKALPQIIKLLKGKGYEFVTVSDLLHISENLADVPKTK